MAYEKVNASGGCRRLANAKETGFKSAKLRRAVLGIPGLKCLPGRSQLGHFRMVIDVASPGGSGLPINR